MTKNSLNIALIPDGSRRAAKKLGLSYSEVYELAAQKVDMTMKFFLGEKNAENFAVYGLSYGNITSRKFEELEPVYKVQQNQYKKWSDDNFFQENASKS